MMTGPRHSQLRPWWALLLCLPLFVGGLGWGLPNVYDVAPDAVTPLRSMYLASHLVDGGPAQGKYPEAHLILAGAVENLAFHVALDAAEREAVASIRDRLLLPHKASEGAPHFGRTLMTEGGAHKGPFSKLILAGRLLSVLLASLLVLMAAMLGERLFREGVGFWTGCLVGMQPVVVHYAATANVDAAYWTWWTLAVGAILLAKRSRTLVIAGVLIALAVGTKDQAAGALPGILVMVLVLHRRKPTRIWLFFGSAAIAYVLCSGMLHWHNYRDHLALIFGEGIVRYRKYALSPVGLAGLTGHIGWLCWVASGPAVAIMAALGIAITLVQRRWKCALLLLPAFTYALAFLLPIGFCYLRFVAPLTLSGAVLAGAAVAPALAFARRKPLGIRWGMGAIGITLLFLPGFRVLQEKRSDPRLACAAELGRLREPGEEVWVGLAPDFAIPTPAPPPPVRFHRIGDLVRSAVDPAEEWPRLLVLCWAPRWATAGTTQFVPGEELRLGPRNNRLAYRVVAAFPPDTDRAFVREVIIHPFLCILERE